MSSLFDRLYEKYERKLKENTNYFTSTFEDNVLLLLKHLSDNDYLSDDRKSIEEKAKDIMNQPKSTKEIILDPTDEALPPVKLHVKQDSDNSESFSVTVIDVKNPQEQKEFKNTMLETIFEDVIDHIKQMTLQGLDSANQAVDQLPPAEGANAQPAGGQTALPGAEEQQPSV